MEKPNNIWEIRYVIDDIKGKGAGYFTFVIETASDNLSDANEDLEDAMNEFPTIQWQQGNGLPPHPDAYALIEAESMIDTLYQGCNLEKHSPEACKLFRAALNKMQTDLEKEGIYGHWTSQGAPLTFISEQYGEIQCTEQPEAWKRDPNRQPIEELVLSDDSHCKTGTMSTPNEEEQNPSATH